MKKNQKVKVKDIWDVEELLFWAIKVEIYDYENYCPFKSVNGGDYLLYNIYERDNINQNCWKKIDGSSCELQEDEVMAVSHEKVVLEVFKELVINSKYREIIITLEDGKVITLKKAKEYHKPDHTCLCYI